MKLIIPALLMIVLVLGVFMITSLPSFFTATQQLILTLFLVILMGIIFIVALKS